MEEFEFSIGYCFKNKSLLRTSFTHSSYAYENGVESNERLEFLGDAILEMISSLYLYKAFPDAPEGKLTRLRAAAVCEPSLAAAARSLDLGKYLLLGKGEILNGGCERDSILSDALEAVIGAVFLDGGLECTQLMIEKLLKHNLESDHSFGDHKTILQEFLQRKSCVPIVYRIIDEHGPDHNKWFTAEVSQNHRVLGIGSGRSKKDAEQQAAGAALAALNNL